MKEENRDKILKDVSGEIIETGIILDVDNITEHKRIPLRWDVCLRDKTPQEIEYENTVTDFKNAMIKRLRKRIEIQEQQLVDVEHDLIPHSLNEEPLNDADKVVYLLMVLTGLNEMAK